MRLSKIDPNSYATPEDAVITHIDVDWTVNFEKKQIQGSVLLKFKIIAKEINVIWLDVDDIKIGAITAKLKAGDIPLNFFISDHVKKIGSKLTIDLPCSTSGLLDILIDYETSPSASALLWLTPEQTLGKQHPFVFSQCQPIHGRSLIPCQDTPAVKFTYTAVLRYPANLIGLMSAVITNSDEGVTTFEQTIPIPSYLIAVAVGKLVSRKLGPISAVWSELELADAAAYEFAETDEMIKAAEAICGPYLWKKYDILVMPPSFPFGGMENPCLTFVTPGLIAKNRSLANVVAHEIAHSWTGNLVTNKNFEHFWMNEGFTVFLEGKIVGALKGSKYRDFHAISETSELYHNIKNQLGDTPELSRLIVDLSNCSPDDSFSLVPYGKGMNFLRYIEQCLGGDEVFDPFLRFYINKYKYQSIVSEDFQRTIYDFFKEIPDKLQALEQIDWDVWLNGEGMPPIMPNYDRSLADHAMKHAKLWAESPIDIIKDSPLIKEALQSELIVELLDKLLEFEKIVELNAEKLTFLSGTYNIENDGNVEIHMRYWLLVIRARLIDKLNEILAFANSYFRMKYVREIYRALANWPEVREAAIANFHGIKNQMMKVCATNCAKELNITVE